MLTDLQYIYIYKLCILCAINFCLVYFLIDSDIGHSHKSTKYTLETENIRGTLTIRFTNCIKMWQTLEIAFGAPISQHCELHLTAVYHSYIISLYT